MRIYPLLLCILIIFIIFIMQVSDCMIYRSSSKQEIEASFGTIVIEQNDDMVVGEIIGKKGEKIYFTQNTKTNKTTTKIVLNDITLSICSEPGKIEQKLESSHGILNGKQIYTGDINKLQKDLNYSSNTLQYYMTELQNLNIKKGE